MKKEKEWPIGIANPIGAAKDFDIEEAAGRRRGGRMERSADLGGDEITTAAARECELVVARFFGAGVAHDHVASFIFEQG